LQPDRTSFARPRRFTVAIAVLCLALLSLLAVVQVVHTHATASDADHCQICVVLHAVTPAVAAAAVIILVHLSSSAPVFETRLVIRSWHPTLFTRPPPAAC
jgi:hypothetical protein